MNNTLTYEDIIKAWESIPKIDKSKIPKAIHCNENTKNKMLKELDVIEYDYTFLNYYCGIDILIKKSIPDNFILMEMQDGSVKLIDLNKR